MMKSQIFISYRLEGGETMAQLLYDRLTERGYQVFYDIETLKSGAFDTKLYQKIEECDDFLLILPPQALDRCIYDEDWVRCELRHALKQKKNIIPVLMRNFVFPPQLPDDIQAVSKINGVTFETMEYLSARLDKIEAMLRSKPVARAQKTATPDNAPALIRNVCSLGSCDFDHIYPADAYYSEVINRDRYQVIYFHVKIAPMFDKDQIEGGMRIYNSRNQLVFEDVATFEWKPTYDLMARSWVIRGSDGTFVNSDVYRAEFWIDDSAVYEYYFKVISDHVTEMDRRDSPQEEEKLNQLSADTRRKLERKVSRPKGLGFHFITAVCGLVALSSFGNDALIVGGVFALAAVGAFCLLVRYTRRYVSSSWLIVILLTTVGFIYYGIYLLLTALLAAFNLNKWTEMLK